MKNGLECRRSSTDRFAGMDVDAGHDHEPGYDCNPVGDGRRIRRYFFGQFRILGDSRPLAFQRKPPKKPLALLKLLWPAANPAWTSARLSGRYGRTLMVCYRELGEEAEAPRVYRRCRDLPSVVMCVKPSAETEAVRNTLTRCAAPRSTRRPGWRLANVISSAQAARIEPVCRALR